jgi:hypothetical protein
MAGYKRSPQEILGVCVALFVLLAIICGTLWLMFNKTGNRPSAVLQPIEGAFGLKLGQPTNGLELTFG